MHGHPSRRLQHLPATIRQGGDVGDIPNGSRGRLIRLLSGGSVCEGEGGEEIQSTIGPTIRTTGSVRLPRLPAGVFGHLPTHEHEEVELPRTSDGVRAALEFLLHLGIVAALRRRLPIRLSLRAFLRLDGRRRRGRI